MSREAVGEFSTVVCLNTLNRQRECFDQMLQKHAGKAGIMLLEGFYKSPAGELISGNVEELFFDALTVLQTGGGNEFYVNFDMLPRIIHLLIRFRNVFWIWRFYS